MTVRVLLLVLLVGFLSSSGSLPFAGIITPLTTLSNPRAAHTATLLPNGNVLIAGGCTADSCEASEVSRTTELFDPSANVFKPSAEMTTQRVGGHTATLLGDGHVLIAGGWTSGNPTSSAELYDSTTNTFTRIKDMTQARADHTATLLDNGKVLIVGGMQRDAGSLKALASAELYDPSTGTFEKTGSLETARAVHTSVLLGDGTVLVIGGAEPRWTALGSVERYGVETGTFTTVGGLNTPRWKHAATLLEGDSVLILGGTEIDDYAARLRSAEVFKGVADVATRLKDMNSQRYKFFASLATLANGNVLVAGGSSQAELFDVTSQTFQSINGDLSANWSFMTATALQDGRVLLIGGYDERIHLTDQAWIFTP
jgi:Kelch motif/Galactose oxidase, central domain